VIEFCCETAKNVDSMVFFQRACHPANVGAERLLPENRERMYPPTATLPMFFGQVLSADGSCQNAVNEAIVNRGLSGLSVGSADTAAYCEARQRLPQEVARELAR
jgi:hypothetical protein